MNVIKEPDGIKKYGEKGKYGVIEIKLKEGKGNITEKKDASSSIVNVGNNVAGVNFQTKEAFDYKGKEETVATQSLKAFKGEGDFLPNGRKLAGAAGESVIIPRSKILTETLALDKNSNSGSPLFIVDGVDKGKTMATQGQSVGYLLDGKLVSTSALKILDAKNIESVVINNENELTRKYGKESILNIKTKEYSGTVGSPSKFTAIVFNNKNQIEIQGPLKGTAGK